MNGLQGYAISFSLPSQPAGQRRRRDFTILPGLSVYLNLRLIFLPAEILSPFRKHAGKIEFYHFSAFYRFTGLP